MWKYKLKATENKKPSCSWDTSRYDDIGDSGKPANPEYDLRILYSTRLIRQGLTFFINRIIIIIIIMLRQLTR